MTKAPPRLWLFALLLTLKFLRASTQRVAKCDAQFPPVAPTKKLQIFYLIDADLAENHSTTNTLLDLLTIHLQNFFRPTEFGLAMFSDKQLLPFGPTNAYCYELRQGFAHEVYSFVGFRCNQEKCFSEKTTPEGSQLEAMAYAANDRGIAWERVEYAAAGEGLPGGDACGQHEEVQRIMVVITDNGYHKAGDGTVEHNPHNLWVKSIKGNLKLPFQMGQDPGRCTQTDYPEPAMVGKLLKEKGITPLFITTSDHVQTYELLLRQMGIFGVVFRTITNKSTTTFIPTDKAAFQAILEVRCKFSAACSPQHKLPEPNVPTNPNPNVPTNPNPNVPTNPEPNVPTNPEPNDNPDPNDKGPTDESDKTGVAASNHHGIACGCLFVCLLLQSVI